MAVPGIATGSRMSESISRSSTPPRRQQRPVVEDAVDAARDPLRVEDVVVSARRGSSGSRARCPGRAGSPAACAGCGRRRHRLSGTVRRIDRTRCSPRPAPRSRLWRRTTSPATRRGRGAARRFCAAMASRSRRQPLAGDARRFHDRLDVGIARHHAAPVEIQGLLVDFVADDDDGRVAAEAPG